MIDDTNIGSGSYSSGRHTNYEPTLRPELPAVGIQQVETPFKFGIAGQSWPSQEEENYEIDYCTGNDGDAGFGG